MAEYVPPLKDMRFALRELAGLDRILALSAFADVDVGTVDQVLEEAGRFASDVLAPLNVPGDHAGCHVENKAVVVAGGFADAYQQFVDNGWQSLPATTEYGGTGLPELTGAVAVEMWQSANMSFALCPLLTAGAIVALQAHGSEYLRNKFLPGLISGESSGTMNLTEPQAGSDLAAVTTRAIPDGDYFRISGTKIFITWGDHPMSKNIVHLVLARLPDAPAGIRGISMFAVPKFLVDDDGKLGARNDVYPTSVEHKLGIHASPTCVMSFGDEVGAIGYLVGEPNKGMACMFTMMNHARLNVGIQGLAVSERAYQLAKTFARDRVQGSAPGKKGSATIINHPDVRRMLMLMKSQIEAMRAVAYVTAAELDLRHHAESAAERDAADIRIALLTPIVKGWLTECAQELTSLGVQIHGGMGFVEETGAAQFMRDARILPIYEGTTGIQANDLVGRKILGDSGKAMAEFIADIRATANTLAGNDNLQFLQRALSAGADDLETATDWLIANAPNDPNIPGAASVNLLMLAGTVLGGWQMARAALAVTGESSMSDERFRGSKLLTANFYAAHILPRSSGYARAAMSGAELIMTMPEELF
ncbi:MAG: acyl-CoA dehydrogenase [Proteobacteria bacterium]|nr:acyl-CoA dehydrogenase [Pseudomonadota bacterium]